MTDSLYRWSIQRGEVITQEQIEAELGYLKEEDPERYRLDLLRLRQECEAFLRAQGTPSSVRTCENGIQILDSGSAMQHQVRRGRNARARMIDAFRQLEDTVDVNELSVDGRRAYEEALRVEGQYVHAIRRVRRELRGHGALQNKVPQERVQRGKRQL